MTETLGNDMFINIRDPFQVAVAESLATKYKHIANIEREAEVLKNVLRDTITTLAIQARDMGHAPVAAKFLELREELESIFPKKG